MVVQWNPNFDVHQLCFPNQFRPSRSDLWHARSSAAKRHDGAGQEMDLIMI